MSADDEQEYWSRLLADLPPDGPILDRADLGVLAQTLQALEHGADPRVLARAPEFRRMADKILKR